MMVRKAAYVHTDVSSSVMVCAGEVVVSSSVMVCAGEVVVSSSVMPSVMPSMMSSVMPSMMSSMMPSMMSSMMPSSVVTPSVRHPIFPVIYEYAIVPLRIQRPARAFAAGQKSRQYRNLQRTKNIISHYTVHVLRTTNHTYFETFSKNNKCCNISVNKTIAAQVQALLSVICAARFHAHVSLAGKERVTLSVRSGGKKEFIQVQRVCRLIDR